MKIPFDIKYRPQIESGEYGAVTRSGLPVRIVCWDAPRIYPLVGFIGDMDAAFRWDDSGCYDVDKIEDDYDLFILIPDKATKELTSGEWTIPDGYVARIAEGKVIIEKEQEELTEFEKAFQQEILEKYGAIVDEAEYVFNIKNTCKKLLEIAHKDLPRWRKMPNGIRGNGEGKDIYIIRYGYGNYGLSSWIGGESGQYLELEELEKLVKEAGV